MFTGTRTWRLDILRISGRHQIFLSSRQYHDQVFIPKISFGFCVRIDYGETRAEVETSMERLSIIQAEMIYVETVEMEKGGWISDTIGRLRWKDSTKRHAHIKTDWDTDTHICTHTCVSTHPPGRKGGRKTER